MNYAFVGKDSVITEEVKEKVIKKMARIEKFLPEDSYASVRILAEKSKNDKNIEITIPIRKRVLRAEVNESDIFTGIDKIIDILENQLVKYKSRLRDRSRKEPSYKEEMQILKMEDDAVNGENLVIEKTKKFPIKPMDAEEAIMEMELLNHTFYVFLNEKDDKVNVIYKRKDGSYGLIEPQF